MLFEDGGVGESEGGLECHLQLHQRQRRAVRAVELQRDEDAFAEDDDVTRVRVLNERVAGLLGHAGHAEDARELVHVERLTTHLLQRVLARLDRRAHAQHAVKHCGGRLDITHRHSPLWDDAEPVDVDGHGGARA